MALCIRKNIYLSIRNNLDYSLKVCSESAKKQHDEIPRALYYRAVLNDFVMTPNQLLFCDEIHKDKKASRHRRGWGERGSEGTMLNRWFKNEARYTINDWGRG